MAKHISVSDVLNLSVSERIQFVEDVWDSIISIPKPIPLSEDQKKELNKRLSEYRKNPQAGSPWEIVKQRFLKSK